MTAICGAAGLINKLNHIHDVKTHKFSTTFGNQSTGGWWTLLLQVISSCAKGSHWQIAVDLLAQMPTWQERDSLLSELAACWCGTQVNHGTTSIYTRQKPQACEREISPLVQFSIGKPLWVGFLVGHVIQVFVASVSDRVSLKAIIGNGRVTGNAQGRTWTIMNKLVEWWYKKWIPKNPKGNEWVEDNRNRTISLTHAPHFADISQRDHHLYILYPSVSWLNMERPFNFSCCSRKKVEFCRFSSTSQARSGGFARRHQLQLRHECMWVFWQMGRRSDFVEGTVKATLFWKTRSLRCVYWMWDVNLKKWML